MTAILDLDPAADRLVRLLDGVSDDELGAPTPCDGTTVGGLLDHLVTLTAAFRDAARKATGTSAPPLPAPEPPADWRTRLPRQLTELVAAWRDPAAWEGEAEAGGVTMTAAEIGTVALDEIVLHGWDLARATGQPFGCDPGSAQACLGFTSAMSVPGQERFREGLFGPVVQVPDDAPLFDRILGLSGRDPAWSPAEASR